MHSSLFNDLGVLQHRDPAALGQFAFEGNRFPAGIGQLVIHRLVFPNYEIRFAIFNNPDRAAILDALRAARLPVALAYRVVIDIAHHVNDLPGYSFFTSRVRISMFVVRQSKWRRRKRSDDDD